MTRIARNIRLIAGAAALALFPVSGQTDSHVMENMLTKYGDLQWVPMAEGSSAEISILWGDPATGPVGLLLRIPPGFEAPMHHHSSTYHAVVVQGTHQHWIDGEDRDAAALLESGSYFSQVKDQVHADANAGDVPVVALVYFDGPVDSIADE